MGTVHKIEYEMPYITSCGIMYIPYGSKQYMDMFGSIIEGNRTWEGVTCQQCLKKNANSACTTDNPSA